MGCGLVARKLIWRVKDKQRACACVSTCAAKNWGADAPGTFGLALCLSNVLRVGTNDVPSCFLPKTLNTFYCGHTTLPDKIKK